MFWTVRFLPVLAVSLLLGAIPSVWARQQGPDRVLVTRSDGASFFVQDGERYPVATLPLSDAEIDAIPLATADATLALLVAPRTISNEPGRWIVEPTTAAGFDVTRPIPSGAICRCIVDRRGKISVFDLSIDEVRPDAGALVQEGNRFNRAPAEGNRYLGIKLSMQYVEGPADDAFQVSSTDFKVVGSDRALRSTASLILPEPRLDGSIFPGATATGYVVFEVRQDEQRPVLLFETNYNGERGVWFTLGGAAR